MKRCLHIGAACRNKVVHGTRCAEHAHEISPQARTVVWTWVCEQHPWIDWDICQSKRDCAGPGMLLSDTTPNQWQKTVIAELGSNEITRLPHATKETLMKVKNRNQQTEITQQQARALLEAAQAAQTEMEALADHADAEPENYGPAYGMLKAAIKEVTG